jgi:hypothetical protein
MMVSNPRPSILWAWSSIGGSVPASVARGNTSKATINNEHGSMMN